jgi:hypothetical protein
MEVVAIINKLIRYKKIFTHTSVNELAQQTEKTENEKNY